MALSQATLKQLDELKDELQEILMQIGDIVSPDQFRCTMVIRYCGEDNPDIQQWVRDHLVMTDDAHDDAIRELQYVRDRL